MKLSKLATAVAAVLSVGVGSAMAGAPISGAMPGGSLKFSDNSAEYLISGPNDVNAATLDVGDSLRGIFSIDNITGSVQIGIGGNSPFNELTGLFQVVVLSKTATANPALFNYTFGYDSTFGQGAGVIGVMYEDPANNFARLNCGGLNDYAACEATATGGGVWASFGFGAEGFWSASNAAETPGIGATLPFATPLGTFGLGLDFITNNTGFAWNKVNCVDTTDFSLHHVDMCGQGGILATGRLSDPTNTPYDIFDNVDFTLNRVPEPSSVALVGLALLGLGAAGRRKS